MPVTRPFLLVVSVLALMPLGCAANPAAPAMHLEPASTTASTLVAFPEYPCLSPDGVTVVFAWAGDLWAAPSAGGTASRLTAHPATERRAAFSPDGSLLAFESDRDGTRNIYLMAISPEGTALLGGSISRVTASDRPQALSAFSVDGKSIYFTGLHEPELHRGSRMYAVDLLPGTAEPGVPVAGPVHELSGAFGSTARPTPGGDILFHRGRFDPDRPMYRGSGSMDIFAMSLEGKSFRQLTVDPAHDFDAWPGLDGSLFFVSSRSGQNNLWTLPHDATESGVKPTQVTNFQPTQGETTNGHGVRDLAVSADGRVAAFCVWDGLYRLDLAQPGAVPSRITIHVGADTQAIDFQRVNIGALVSEAALSPDGKTIAIIARGEVYVRPTTEGRPSRRVTTTYGRERDLAWSPDGATLYFASDEPAQGESESPAGAYAIFAATIALAREDIKPPKPEEPKEEPAPADSKKDETKADEPKKDDAAPADPEKSESKKDDPKKPDPKKPDPGKRWAEAITFETKALIATGDDCRRPTPSPDGKRLLSTSAGAATSSCANSRATTPAPSAC